MPENILARSNHTAAKDSSNGGYPGKPISEIVTNGLFTVDKKWTVQYWNVGAEKLLGVKAADIIGKNIWEQFAESLPISFYASYHKAFLQEVPIHFAEYWAEKDAWFDVITYHFNNLLSVSFKNSHHPLDPEHPEAPVQQLKILTELYRFVTEITNDCLWEWNLGTDELFWIDGGHKRVFGYPIENALIPISFWKSRIHPEDIARVLRRLKEMIHRGDGDIWEDEYRFQRSNGKYAYVHDRAHIIYDENHTASRMIGATQDITNRKLTEQRLIDANIELAAVSRQRTQDITRAILVGQEKERTQIGRELHDNLNQILGAAKMYIEMARTDEENSTMCLNKSSQYIVQVIEEIRKISKGLVTPVMVMGLAASINMTLQDLRATSALELTFMNDGVNEAELDEKLQLAIFRILQEQLSNIVKHARATQATIQLTQKPKKIIMLITDNGIGHELIQKNPGVGFINIRSRVEEYDGKVTIVSKPKTGFTLKIELPLQKVNITRKKTLKVS